MKNIFETDSETKQIKMKKSNSQIVTSKIGVLAKTEQTYS